MIYNILAKILKLFSVPVIVKQRPKIIGITGSVGKTSTKEAMYAVLKKEFSDDVARSYKNLNTEVGLPLVILRIDISPQGLQWIYVVVLAFFKFLKYRFFSSNYPKILILEYAADKVGDIKYLTEIAKPDIACITEIGAAHLEQFKTVEAVAQEKMLLVKNMRANGIAVLNEDNPYIKSMTKNLHYEKIWFHGSCLDGPKNAAIKIGEIFKIDKEKIDEALSEMKPIKGRMNIFNGIKNSILIDDSYNASPLSMNMALKYLKNYKKGCRKVAILGDMRELGESSEEEHKKLGKEIVKNAQFAILIGPYISRYTKEVLDKHKFDHKSYINFTKAKDEILNNINNKDVVLIKASQNTLFLERVTEMLLADKKDIGLLCRQEEQWLKIKAKTP